MHARAPGEDPVAVRLGDATSEVLWVRYRDLDSAAEAIESFTQFLPAETVWESCRFDVALFVEKVSGGRSAVARGEDRHMSQYLLAVHHDGTEQYEPEQMAPVFESVGRFNEQLQAEGTWVFAGGLEWVEASTIVDATGDRVLTTDGPFVESKEHIGGFWVIEVPDLVEALKVAADASRACRQVVEVRPFQGE